MLALAGCSAATHWQLDEHIQNVKGDLPNLSFRLVDDLGEPVTATNYRGKIVMMYFGYTHCPDVCPLTMAHLHAVLDRIGAKAASHVQVLFVTVDPARDTLPVLKSYLAAFDPRFMGLRGSQTELGPLVRRYRAIYHIEKPVPADGDYLVTHSAAIYIFGPRGHIHLLVTPGAQVDTVAHDVKLLVEKNA
ncbi:MAG TPA: SCO family protein [Nevskiaceae bacterium]